MAIQIHVTEHKSVGSLANDQVGRTVRVFVDRDYDYGYFYPENQLFNELTPEQQHQYLSQQDVKLDVPASLAQKIIDQGQSIKKYRPRVDTSNA